MKKKQEEATEVQGTEEANETNVSRETSKERKPSKLYAIRQFMGAVKKLKELDMVGEQQMKLLQDIQANLINGYIIEQGETI